MLPADGQVPAGEVAMIKTNKDEYDLAFRIVGSVQNDRKLVVCETAFDAHCANDARAEVDRESYLSLFSFTDDFRVHLSSSGSTSGFDGPTWAPILWVDIDGPSKDIAGLAIAIESTRKFVSGAIDRYHLQDSTLLVFFSGAKGFHIGLPSSLWNSVPALDYHRRSRNMAESLALEFGVQIDASVYDRVRAFRAPNSRHPRTKLHKRRLLIGELMTLSPGEVVELAKSPIAFEFETVTAANDTATTDWQHALTAVVATPEPCVAAGASLNRLTLDFIRAGAEVGERNNRLFSAAANLAEFDCSGPLAKALLTEAARDSGLAPCEIKQTIAAGLAHGGSTT